MLERMRESGAVTNTATSGVVCRMHMVFEEFCIEKSYDGVVHCGSASFVSSDDSRPAVRLRVSHGLYKGTELGIRRIERQAVLLESGIEGALVPLSLHSPPHSQGAVCAFQ